MDENKRIVEINGIRVEVDLRTAKRVDSFRVGDPVRLLRKEYQNSFKTCTGVIVGFTDFANRPTINVLYVSDDYSTKGDLKFISITADTEDVEIAPLDDYKGIVDYDQVLERLDRMITEAEESVRQAKTKKQLFMKHFGRVAGDTE